MGSNPAGRARIQALGTRKPSALLSCATPARLVIYRAITPPAAWATDRSRSPRARWSSSPRDRAPGSPGQSGAGYPRSRSVRASTGTHVRGAPSGPLRAPRRLEAASRRCASYADIGISATMPSPGLSGAPEGWALGRARHDLRLTFATRLRATRVHEEDRSALLRHACRSMPEHYASADIRRLIDLANRVLDRVETMTILRVANGCGPSPTRRVALSLCG